MLGLAIFRQTQRVHLAEKIAAPTCEERFVRASPVRAPSASVAVAANLETGFVFANTYGHSQTANLDVLERNADDGSGHFLGALRKWFGDGAYTDASAITYYIEDTQTGVHIEARYWLEWGAFYGLSPELRLGQAADDGDAWDPLALESLAAFDACIVRAPAENVEVEIFCESSEACGLPVEDPGYPIAVGLRDGSSQRRLLPLDRAMNFLLRFANEERGLEEASEDETAAAHRARNVLRPLWIWNEASDAARRATPETQARLAAYFRSRVSDLLGTSSSATEESSQASLAVAAKIYSEEEERAQLLPPNLAQELQEIAAKEPLHGIDPLGE